MSEEWTIESVVKDFISERKLSRRKKAFLEQCYQKQMDSFEYMNTSNDLSIAPRHLAQHFGLEEHPYHYWCFLVAWVLDFLEDPNKETYGGYFLSLREHIIDYEIILFDEFFPNAYTSEDKAMMMKASDEWDNLSKAQQLERLQKSIKNISL